MSKQTELQKQATIIEAWAAEIKQVKNKLNESIDSYFKAVAEYKRIKKDVRHDK